jgi:C-terminal processing protease CtpA/Prc
MKLSLLSISILLSIASYCQTSISDTNKIATFCKVWGFLKYHHPIVAKGKYDWDKEFLEKLSIIEHANTKEEISDFYKNWIKGLGKLKKDSKRTPPSNAILSNYDFNWLKDTLVFSKGVTKLLLQVQNNTRAKNYYVKRNFLGLAAAFYVNENIYQDSILPSTAMRLLVLSRYWNIVNYFYPYKYLTDTNWQSVISEFVPKLIAADNIQNYHFTFLELFASLNDTHTDFNPQLFGSYKLPPFNNKIINDKIIVLDPYNDSICKRHDIKYGDVILAINGKSVKSIIDYYSKYVSASNYASLCRQLAPQYLWSDVKDSAVLTCERDGQIFNRVLPAYPNNLLSKDFRTLWIQSSAKPTVISFNSLNKNIAYINLGRVKSKKEMKKVLKNVRKTDAVILDIRNYPKNITFRPITNFFCTSRKPFAKYANQSIKYPGTLVWSKTTHCGKHRGKKYKGKVAVLIDESTISRAEHFTMALKTILNVVLIGSHTAGANGSNHAFMLTATVPTSFSNQAAYYPNGDQMQRKGIVPDIEVFPTIEGVRLRKDEVLDKAIEILSSR